MNIRPILPEDAENLVALFGSLSARDITVIREDLTEDAAIAALVNSPELRWVALDDATKLVGYATVRRLPGWSDHVGELRLVVDPTARGGGYGRALAQQALRAAFTAGIRKVLIELATDEDKVVAMFTGLGFTGEALLRNHIRDRDGNLRDLVVLAHHVDEVWGNLDAIGVSDALLS
ncbi:GNAT family N-acetyltransferase [Nocardia lasii]|uniref:GNAT family N-acetyltransferase n=1 Tax=Nocardia lasii TaxID=1616107 RepID=A0ABW1JP61_9NOCA